MHTTTIKLLTSPARRLAWGETLYCGERVGLSVSGTALAGHAPATSYLMLTDGDCVPLAAAGPFAAGAGSTWTATLELATEPMLVMFASLRARVRIAAWSTIIDTGSGSLVGAGEAIVAQNSYPIEPGEIADMPEIFVRRGIFESLLVDRPASLTSLADQLAEILEALKGA